MRIVHDGLLPERARANADDAGITCLLVSELS